MRPPLLASLALVLLVCVEKMEAFPAEGVVKFTHLWISSDGTCMHWFICMSTKKLFDPMLSHMLIGKSHLKHCEVENMDKSDDFGTPQYVSNDGVLATSSLSLPCCCAGEGFEWSHYPQQHNSNSDGWRESLAQVSTDSICNCS